MDVQATILDTAQTVKAVQKDFQEFTSLFVVTAAAVCVGLATRTMIEDLMNEAVLPLLQYLLQKSLSYIIFSKLLQETKSLPFIYLVLTKISKVMWIIFLWLIVLYLTYVSYKAFIKIDLITNQVNLVEDVTKYVTDGRTTANQHISLDDTTVSNIITQKWAYN